MPSRRLHTKTRHGCLLCKSRRVKCDLTRPACGSCAKRGVKCSLEHGTQWTSDTPVSYSAIRSQRHTSSKHSTTYSSAGTLSPDLYPPLTNPDESSLLRRFSSEVVPSVVGRSYSLIWKSTVYSIHTAPAYVVHCMFSVSAIYYAETANLSSIQVDHYRNLGIHYENLALSLLRPELNCINADNCEAIYASTALIFLSTIALPRFDKEAPDSFLDRLVELSELAKGPLAVRKNSPKPLHSLYNLKPWNEPIELPAELTDPLDNIRRVVEAGDNRNVNTTRKAIYLQAIDTLKQTLIAMFHNKLYPLIIFMFLSVVDRRFIELVALKDVTALRILGHYGVCSNYIPRKWWNRYWGRDIIDAVVSILDEEDGHRPLSNDRTRIHA